MTGKWTKGEWRIGAGGHIIGDRVTPVAFICRGGDFLNTPGEANANAHLIAATPALAKLAQEMIGADSDGTWDTDREWLVEAAKDALSQALGEGQ